MKPPILILLPTLHRPAAVGAALESLLATGTGLSDVLILEGEGGIVAVVNSVPRELLAQYQIVGFFGDDVRMRTHAWDALVLSKLSGKTGLVYGRDGHQDKRLATHPFVTSNVFLALGFVFPSQLHHFSGDNFLMQLLSPLGKVEYVETLFTEHLHPHAGKAAMDKTYEQSQTWWTRDQEAWKLYSREMLALDRERVARLTLK
jgi:hypothetical protein